MMTPESTTEGSARDHAPEQRKVRSSSCDRGSMSIEMSIMMGTVFLSFLMLSMYAGRVVRQEADVRSAAHAAARAGSLHSWANANAAALDAGQQNLATSGTACVGGGTVTVTSSEGQFEQKAVNGGGAPGFISVEVDCTISPVPLLGTNQYDFVAVEIIDTYRQED